MTYDSRSGVGYGYGYNAANRMESMSLTGVVQAEYEYNAFGQQVVRRLTQAGQTIHSVHDADGNRIAEYDHDSAVPSTTLLREYVWMNGEVVAVIEGGSVYYVRTDHIGRPVFATNGSGTKVWTASYLPFGGVHTSTGSNIGLRFPGQWFQSESALHQNWMRDYDPTTGRYVQADPLGLVDGASVYGYVRQNPGKYTDPTGEGIPAAVALYALFVTLDILSHDGCVTAPDLAYIILSNLNPFNKLKPLNRMARGGPRKGGGGNEKPWTDEPGSTPPFKGKPCTTVRCGTQSREYAEDGYPKTDRDWPHPDEKGPGSRDHSHDWGRPEGDGPPTHKNRGVGRDPKSGDPPAPRGPNVPPS